MWRTTFTSCLLLISLAVVPGLAAPMRCVVNSKFACTPAGCAGGKIGMFNLIDIELGKFSRCDASGCDDYSANFGRSGAYFVIDLPGRGMVAKLSTNGAEYLEVATLGNTALISFGTCSGMN